MEVYSSGGKTDVVLSPSEWSTFKKVSRWKQFKLPPQQIFKEVVKMKLTENDKSSALRAYDLQKSGAYVRPKFL